MNRRAWSDQDIDYLRRNYADMRAEDIASALGCSVRRVYTKARALSLGKSVSFTSAHRIQPGSNVQGGGIVSRRHAAWNKGVKGSAIKSAEAELQRRARISKRLKDLWGEDEFRRVTGQKIIQSSSARWKRDDYRERIGKSISASLRRSWRDPSDLRLAALMRLANLPPEMQEALMTHINLSSMLKELRLAILDKQEGNQ